jgi:hypothetical protein
LFSIISCCVTCLLVIILSGLLTAAGSGVACALSLRTSRSATSIGRGESEINVLFEGELKRKESDMVYMRSKPKLQA